MKLMDFTSIALKNLFSKPVTCNYPAEPAVYPERSRGHIVINIDDCIMCGLCMRKCPSDAIRVDRNKKEWSIERMGCVQCENCVNACPKKCLSIQPGYTAPSATKTVDTFAQPIPQTPAGKVSNDMSKCILCGLCARKCPQECITVDRTGEKTWTIDRDKCVQCGACVDACLKFKALSMVTDDGEKGIVVLHKDTAKPAAPKAETPKAEAPAPKEEKEKAEENALTSGKIVNDISICILCGLCARKCPQECITVDRKEAKTWSINRDDCIQCGACIDGCIKFHCLKFAQDDGESGIVTLRKEG